MSGTTTRCSPLTLLALVVATLVSACSSGSAPYYPPVEDRGLAVSRVPSNPSLDDTRLGQPDARLLPGAENAGKPGYYSVRPGDTLIRIALDTGHTWKDLARWNALDNPNLIEVGQVLRIIPPVVALSALPPVVAPVAQVEPSTSAVTRPVTGSTVTPVKTTPSKATVTAATTASSTSAAAATTSEEEPGFIWPSSGTLLADFDGNKNKGVDLGGKPGDPVMASANGRVVYAGSGLRGYGNLVILKHNNTYLTAYAHNQSILVKEDQTVRKGQKIAEMGSSDADRTKLHFEIRRLGKPVDPTKYLPAR